MDGMWSAAQAAARLLRQAGRGTVRIVTHIDADALSAAGIAATALQRAGIEFRVEYCKSLDEATLARIRADPGAVDWFTDLGSAVHERLGRGPKIVTDHHEVASPEGAHGFPHVNPHVHGIPQDDSISGAGCAYLVASALDPANADLSAMAIVGALGDLQDQRHGRLVGWNRKLLADGEAHGVLRVLEDVRYFGRSTRPLPKFLRYAEPSVPGIGDSEDAAIEFLVAQRIHVRTPAGAWRAWADLAADERDRVWDALQSRYAAAGVPAARARGEVYELPRETQPELRDAKEFSTLLNSTARYDRPEVGLALAMGARDGVLDEARSLLKGHRRSLGDAIQTASRQGLTELGPIAYYHAGEQIRDTILGIVTGILLGNQRAAGRVLVGLADNRQGAVKVSARAPDALVARGLDLSVSLRTAAEAVGGSGGGHAGAAGATIPHGKEPEFLERASKAIQAQIQPA